MAEIVKVDLNNKYVVILNGVTIDEARSISNGITKWLTSKEPFFMIYHSNQDAIKLVKVDDETQTQAKTQAPS